MMQIKRFKNIVAFKSTSDELANDNFECFALHIENMEVAKISNEAFETINNISFETPLSSSANLDIHESILEWNNEVNSQSKIARLDYRIRNISLNVNQICNLKCSYCAAGGDGTYGSATKEIELNQTKIQLEYLISKLKDGDSFTINFVGGEPLLHPHIITEIYDFVLELKRKKKFMPHFRIVTNGTQFNNKTLDFLKSRDISITISIDGVKSINDFARPSKDGKSTTDKIELGLKNLFDSGFEKNKLNASLITSSSNTNLYENFIFVETLGFGTFELAFEINESDINCIYRYISDYEKILKHLWKTQGEAGIRRITAIDQYFKLLDSQTKIENHCGAGKSYLMIDSKNQAYNCVWEANYPDRQVGKSTNFNNTSPNLLKPLIEINNCHDCWAKFLCGGGCMYINELHNGNKHKKSESFCLRTRLLISIVIMYYKQARSLETEQ